MKVKCVVCGHSLELTKAHQDYGRLARHASYPFICTACSDKIQREAQNNQEFRHLKGKYSL
ncbi:MAG TPA: DUF2197 domain-containing protein [Desulfobacteria bacterium]|nr:DUF2197 domain-containing protein [Desulfobacteria bacterium]